ncbi:PGDYG domain-containing protein [Enterococcus diestrammenae]|uniref:Uncharacterized protein n=1 Tax=Enterococcus diestrammenae TaxID=1155073 RepID=A0ABV0F3B2_9ENTE|nr:PGDYG domain-containing protein [Enterococcus diestrammenae]KAF1296263.1 hypothetical protein BAU18_14660 [Enterococcus diestrammenae]
MELSKPVKAVKKPIPVTAQQVTKRTVVQTIEGPLTAQPGDWIITGVEGEQWPVKREIFEKTYTIKD